jgi:hypothetical protein
MKQPALDPDVADVAPNESVLTTYDEQHLVTYWRLLQSACLPLSLVDPGDHARQG